MSENESFIDEVTEEVRRDKLYLFFKKYAWIGIIAVIAIVLASVFIELRSRANILRSERLGEFLSLSLNDFDQKQDTGSEDFSEVLVPGSLVSLLFKARMFEQESEYENAKTVYESILQNEEISSSFKDFAKFKLLLLAVDDPIKTKKLLTELIGPNNSFNLLALEQNVFFNIRQKKWEEAKININLLLADPNVGRSIKSRSIQVQQAISSGGS